MRTLRILAAAALALALVASPAHADDIAATIKNRYSSISTFQAFFTQYLTHRESGRKEKRDGTLLFKRPFLINWTTIAPHAETLIVTEREVWDYVPDESIAYRFPREIVEDSRSLIQVVTGQALLTKDYDVKDAGTEGKLRILRLLPKEPTTQMVEATLYVDPVKGYIQRAVVTDFYGNTNDVRFNSFIPDADVSSRDFRFTPPKGVEVEDRISSDGIEERDLFR